MLVVVVVELGCDVVQGEEQAHFVLLPVLKCVVAVAEQLLVVRLPAVQLVVAQLVVGGNMMKYWVGD